MATAGPVHRVQSAVEVYGYPRGHMGHMTPEEETALDDFKLFLIQKGLYSPKDETDEYGTHDDATLLRFLRARRFSVQDAYKQFKDTEEWRNSNELDLLYRTIDLEHYDETRKLYPQWTGRRDRRGIPLYVFEVRHLNSKTMAAYEKLSTTTYSMAKADGKTPAKFLRLFALYENLVRFVMPMCTALTDREHPTTPITQSNNIVDISGVGLKQFWNLRAHMQDASTLATAHYPETLDRIFIIGAPAFFPTVWSWIKRWFDPITTSKIFILSQSEMNTTLRKFIDPANIPKKFGGELDYEFGMMPVLDPAYKDYITWEGKHTDFPDGPLFWHDKGDYIELEAVGSVNGEERSEMICTMRKPPTLNTPSEKQNGDVQVALLSQKAEIRPELLSAPTEQEIPMKVLANPKMPDEGGATVVTEKAPPEEFKSEANAVEAGEVVPASRPEPVTFVTAQEGIKTLSLEKDTLAEKPLMNGTISEPQIAAVASPVALQAVENDKPAQDDHNANETNGGDGNALVKTLSKGTVGSSATKSNKSQSSAGGLKKKILQKLKG